MLFFEFDHPAIRRADKGLRPDDFITKRFHRSSGLSLHLRILNLQERPPIISAIASVDLLSCVRIGSSNLNPAIADTIGHQLAAFLREARMVATDLGVREVDHL